MNAANGCVCHISLWSCGLVVILFCIFLFTFFFFLLFRFIFFFWCFIVVDDFSLLFLFCLFSVLSGPVYIFAARRFDIVRVFRRCCNIQTRANAATFVLYLFSFLSPFGIGWCSADNSWVHPQNVHHNPTGCD